MVVTEIPIEERVEIANEDNGETKNIAIGTMTENKKDIENKTVTYADAVRRGPHTKKETLMKGQDRRCMQ